MLFDVADDLIRQPLPFGRQMLVLRLGKPPAVAFKITVQPPRCPCLDVSLAKCMQRKLVTKVGQTPAVVNRSIDRVDATDISPFD